jgi:hypothetical protein
LKECISVAALFLIATLHGLAQTTLPSRH